MASYGSNNTEEPGQYPTTAWSDFGLPEQNFGSGAPGSSPTSSVTDMGDTNEPGQYPDRETFTGVTLGGTGAPGTQGIGRDLTGGPDTIRATKPTFYKSIYEIAEDPNSWDEPNGAGYKQITVHDSISGEADWTQANDNSYGPGFNMPGVEGNTPTPGSGQFQTGAGSVMYGGRLNGTGHTSKHPSWSGPGT
jgi:hypothetical protein